MITQIVFDHTCVYSCRICSEYHVYEASNAISTSYSAKVWGELDNDKHNEVVLCVAILYGYHFNLPWRLLYECMGSTYWGRPTDSEATGRETWFCLYRPGIHCMHNTILRAYLQYHLPDVGSSWTCKPLSSCSFLQFLLDWPVFFICCLSMVNFVDLHI